MKLVWFSWKDTWHPQAGGAEKATHSLLKQWVAEGNEAVLITSQPPGSPEKEEIDGYTVIRSGNRYSVYWKAYRYFQKNLRNWPDLVVEEINTIPFFTRFYVKAPSVMLFWQLAREVWFYEMIWPFSWIGYALEALYLRLLSGGKVLTESNSTKRDLQRFGFRPENIRVIRLGTDAPLLPSLSAMKKYSDLTVLSHGAMRPMKRTREIVRAFEYARVKMPSLKLILSGSDTGSYGQKVRKDVEKSSYRSDISMLGRTSNEKRDEVMKRSHLIAVASVKEGWGLIVTEANRQGTPAIGADVDGLRDSIKDGITGILAPPTPQGLGEAIVKLLSNQDFYGQIRTQAWEDSKQYTFENSYADFRKALDELVAPR